MTYWIKDEANLKDFIDENFKHLDVDEFLSGIPAFPFEVATSIDFDGDYSFEIDGVPLRQSW